MTGHPFLQRHEPSPPWRLFALVLTVATLAAVLILMVADPAATPSPITPATNSPAVVCEDC